MAREYRAHVGMGDAPGGGGGTPTGQVLFDANVAQAGLGNYAATQNPNRITIVNDPILGASRKVMNFTVFNTDDQLTGNPRAQVETEHMFNAGDEIWVGWCTLFPSSFPDSLPPGGASWLTFAEVYGPPYDGASPVKFGMRSGQQALTWQRNDTYAWDIPWEKGPIQKNIWYDFVVHELLSTNGAVGFAEVYLNTGSGWVQQQLLGQSRLYMSTLDASNSGGANYHKLALYYQSGMYTQLTLYHGEHRVGTSFDVVDPHSYG